LTVNGVGSSHRPVVDPEKVLTSWGMFAQVCPLLVRSLPVAGSEDTRPAHLQQVTKIPRSNWTANFSRTLLLTSEPISLFILHQSYLFLRMHLHCISHYGADPHVHGAQQSILLVITALRHHSTSTFRRTKSLLLLVAMGSGVGGKRCHEAE
jgi:hypothetical protein